MAKFPFFSCFFSKNCCCEKRFPEIRQRCQLCVPSSVLLVFPGLAVGLDPEGYGNPDFCWLSMYDTLIWSLAGPVAVAVSVREALIGGSPLLFRGQSCLKFVSRR